MVKDLLMIEKQKQNTFRPKWNLTKSTKKTSCNYNSEVIKLPYSDPVLRVSTSSTTLYVARYFLEFHLFLRLRRPWLKHLVSQLDGHVIFFFLRWINSRFQLKIIARVKMLDENQLKLSCPDIVFAWLCWVDFSLWRHNIPTSNSFENEAWRIKFR